MIMFYLLIGGLVVTVATAFIAYVDSESKRKGWLLFFTLCGGVFATIGAIQSNNENNRNQELVAIWQHQVDSMSQLTHGLLTGGDAAPHITFGPARQGVGYAFYLENPSRTLSIFDIETTYIEVTADTNRIVWDAWPPQLAARIATMQPFTVTQLDEELLHEFMEGHGSAYNFFTICRNGAFREQMVIRLVGSERLAVYRIMKGDEVVYTSPIPKGFLRSWEKEVRFPYPEEGRDKSVTYLYLKKTGKDTAKIGSFYAKPKDYTPVTGKWQSTDSFHRFTLLLEGDKEIGQLTEKNKDGESLVSQVQVKYLSQDSLKIIRAHTDYVAEFLGLRKELRKAMAEEEVESSYLILHVMKDKVTGSWHGFSIDQHSNGRFKEIIQPDDASPKLYNFKPVTKD